MQTYYELLEVDPTASNDEIRRAFRRAISTCHPDKVQHLDSEQRNMAAARAAGLTQAYRTLRSQAARATYDSMIRRVAGDWGLQMDRVGASELIRRAALWRLRHALEREFGPCEGSPEAGFDLACTFSRGTRWGTGGKVRILGRSVVEVDRAAVRDSWSRVLQLTRHDPWETCVFLMGQTLAPASELGRAIDELQRRSGRAKGRLTVLPIDVRTWSVPVSADTPPAVQALLARLQSA